MRFDASRIGPDPEAYLAAQEARVPGITPGVQKRILWAGETGGKTALALVYVHGFSATSEELRPLPDRVAQALNANLVFTRLTGHGLPGEALARASLLDWKADIAEALAVAERIGQRTVLLACSTGATLATLALPEPMGQAVAAAVFISPNFRVKAPAARILTWPLVRHWGPLVAGRMRGFAPRNADHARYWTCRYPTEALIPMATAVAAAARAPVEAIGTPALMLYDRADTVVDHRATEALANRWGGPILTHPVSTGAEDDPDHHVIAGAILSPRQTGPMAQTIATWIKETTGV
ncbi:alpha/beta hydrolase [Tropicibacter sp. S64]|uniref:alpha/beta hydrolase n=1 Tax=Tropicibacter sp. S64 TaxID=3415122 RepID=UPI003C79C7E2